jgi:hypothetical protein
VVVVGEGVLVPQVDLKSEGRAQHRGDDRTVLAGTGTDLLAGLWLKTSYLSGLPGAISVVAVMVP